MTNDPLRVFEPGFSGDGADKEARELIDAWRDEWHLEPEPEMDNNNSKVYESLVGYVANALTTTREEARAAAFKEAAESVKNLPQIGRESLDQRSKRIIKAIEAAANNEEGAGEK